MGQVVSFRKFAEAHRRHRRPASLIEAYRLFWAQSLDRLATYLKEFKQKDFEMKALKVEAPAGQPTITMTRTFDAPRDLVWRVMTSPEHIARWWGPRGANTKLVKHDFRPGGTWRFEHRQDDGSSLIFRGTYLEVLAPEKFVNTFGMEGFYEDKLLVETHTLTEVDGKTLYTSFSRFDSVEDRDGMVASGMETGATESLDQLAEILAELQAK
jgi:uncharacterized protein YndB with AHSA1/START domain